MTDKQRNTLTDQCEYIETMIKETMKNAHGISKLSVNRERDEAIKRMQEAAFWLSTDIDLMKEQLKTKITTLT